MTQSLETIYCFTSAINAAATRAITCFNSIRGLARNFERGVISTQGVNPCFFVQTSCCLFNNIYKNWV